MAHGRDEVANPFWWVVLGFICGAIATLGALILYGGLTENAAQAPVAVDRSREPQTAETVRIPLDPPRRPVAPPPSSPEPVAPAKAPEAAAPPAARRAPPPYADDAQVADDAAAAGMTTRSGRD